MIDINKLRRLAQAANAAPDGVSLNWVKLLQDFQKEANPAAVSELLDRIEAAESDAIEQARLNGMGASREAALMAKLAATETAWKVSEKSCHDLTEKVIPNLRDQLEAAEKERDALRAKIEEMEKQEPVVEVGKLYMPTWCGVDSVTSIIKRHGLKIGSKLYLAPGAKVGEPAPSVPDGWKLVPTAESRHPGIYKMLSALHAVDNTPGASEWASYAAFLAAAPEAKS